MSEPRWVQDPDGGWHQAIEPVAAKPKNGGCAVPLFALLLIVGGLLAGVVIFGKMVDNVTPSAATTSTVGTEPTTTATVVAAPVAPALPPAEVLAGCTPAVEAELSLIRPVLTEGAVTLVRAYSTAEGSRHYVAADVLDGSGQVLEHDAVWVIDGGVPYSLSGSANRFSILPDGRDLLGLSAGDEVPLALRDCPRAAEAAGL